MASSVVTNESDGEEHADNYTKYLIIGAGIAGLSAANQLAKHGIKDFKVLEARNRLGGRIITIQIGSTKADLGASWIHGVLGNPLYELAASNGLIDHVPPEKPHNVAATTEDGRRLPFSILQETYEAYFWFFKRCEEYFLCKYQPPEGINSVGQHVELEISIYLQRFPQQQRHLRRLVFNYLLKRECCITGCDSMNEVDLKGIGSYTELPGGNILLPHGYTSLLGPILKNIPEGNILKNHAVKHIIWMYRTEMEESGNGVSSDDDDGSESSVRTVKSNKGETEDEDDTSSVLTTADTTAASSIVSSVSNTPSRRRSPYPNVKIECENGSVFYADHVICTVPLGVLKHKGSELFQPTLPPDKRAAMEKLNFGTVDKIYLEYDRPFLSPDITEIILLWDDTASAAVKKPVSERWYRSIYSFCKVSETLIVGWISGEDAKYMETLKINVIADTCTQVLKKFLADPYIPKPKSCIFTAWNSQPYSKGSYSSLAIGGQQSHIEKMGEPLYQKHNTKKIPVVAFAGEHCHPSFYSTGHGAYLTGRAVAQKLIKATKKQKDEEVYNLAAASVADLSTWLEEVQLGEKKLDDFKSRPKRDGGKFKTPR